MSKWQQAERHNKDKYIVGLIFVILMALGIYLIWASAKSSSTTNPVATSTVATTSPISGLDVGTSSVPTDTVNLSSLDKFAICLANKGATMYGAVWCSHCQAQKKLFGTSWKYIKYVECPDNAKLCLDKGIEGYPTWIMGDGARLVGEKTFADLAKASGCALP